MKQKHKYLNRIVLFAVIYFPSILNAQSENMSTSILEEQFEAKVYTSKKADFSLPFRVYDVYKKKVTPSADSTLVPLILFLHGAGERGKDNQKQLSWGMMDLLSYIKGASKQAVIIAPQCPENQRWVEVDWNLNSHSMPEKISEPLNAAWELVNEYAQKPYVDEQRIIVIGLSMGGYGTWDLLQRYPDSIYKAVPICGGGDTNMAVSLINNDIWVFHGQEDTIVPHQRSADMVRALKDLGAPNIRFTSFPYVGHNSWSPAFAMNELWDWLIE